MLEILQILQIIEGLLVFRIQDAPRLPIGLNDTALNQFQKIDPQIITGFILETFSAVEFNIRCLRKNS